MIDPVTIGVVIGGCSSLCAAVYAWQFPSGRQRFTRCGQRWSQALDESRGETLRSSLGVLISRVGGVSSKAGRVLDPLIIFCWFPLSTLSGPRLILLCSRSMSVHFSCWHMPNVDICWHMVAASNVFSGYTNSVVFGFVCTSENSTYLVTCKMSDVNRCDVLWKSTEKKSLAETNTPHGLSALILGHWGVWRWCLPSCPHVRKSNPKTECLDD